MAYRLKNRQRQIPNGYKFIQAETGWQAGRYASFQSIVNSLIAHRRSRPDLVTKHNWPTDLSGVERDVEQFNVRLCLKHGWMEFVDGMDVGGGLPPKPRPPSAGESSQVSAAAGKAKKIWSGVRTLNDWIDSGEPPVEPEIANRRALVCSKCPKNTPGDFTSWFTKPAAGAIKTQIEKLQERKLATPHDAAINVCDICLCPLKLKVHTPTKFIKQHLTEEVLADLLKVKECWIVSEITAK